MSNFNARITNKNLTPILQIEGNTKERIDYLDNLEVDTVTQKTITELYEGIPVNIPVISGNGVRGLLRRVIGTFLIEKYLQKGYKIKAEDFHLMMAGGGSNYQTQPFEVEEKVRELNPVVSLFGTSLAIEGKLIITNLKPQDALIKVIEGKNGIFAISQVLQKFTFVKVDDILQKTKFGRFLTKEDIEEWEKKVEVTQEQRKKEREIEAEKKTKKVAIQGVFAKYYIVPNTVFNGYISIKYPLTEIERGLLLKGLERLTQEQLGSTKNLGFGVCDWEISIGNGSKIVARSKNENIFEKNIQMLLNDEDEQAVKKAEEWLENIAPENIEISKVLIKKNN
jgi:CRISPR type IV-associated protein Csf2